jgi:GR25 family glycosyltransferase involved in LPS biosynthesis
MIDLSSYFHKVSYINLEEDIQKKKYFEKEIQKSSFLSNNCRRYDAVIGKYIDIRLIPDSIITTKAKNDIIEKKQKTYGISLTYGSLACALSHHLIYQECKNHHKPFCIFEDDIIIDDNFDKNLNSLIVEISNNNYAYDIIYLGYNEIPGFQKKIINNVVSEPRGLITGLYGYILSNRGAQKLLDNVFPLYKQIDSCISDHRDKFDLLCATNKFVHVRTDFGSKTQLDASCKNVHTEVGPYSEWHKLFQ